MAKFNELKYELPDHPPYSPDLAPSDFCLFLNLKNVLAGKCFTYNYFNQEVELLEKRWTKCIEVSGDYVEK